MLVITLNIEKVETLYYEIAHDQYLYSDSEQTYYKLSVAMDRMKNTVETINNMPAFRGRYNEDAIEFVSWIFYLDMLIACIEAVSKSFSYSIKYDKNIFLKYHNHENKNDKDFFRFIRAIVLPHALELDCKKQMDFTNGKKAYCPFVVWDTNNCIRIVYYNADVNNDLQWYIIDITDIEKFVAEVYSEIDKLIPIISKRKRDKKNRDKVNIRNEQYDENASMMEKCTFLRNLTIKYGDLDDKSGHSFAMGMLERCQKILSMKFKGKNKKIFDKYLIALNFALDDYYTYMCNQSNDETLLGMVLSPWHDYTSKTDFDGVGYEINKICAEMEDFDEYVRRYYFDEYYEALRPVLITKVYVSKRISMERICYLTIIAFFFDRLKYKESYRKAFESVLDEIMEV